MDECEYQLPSIDHLISHMYLCLHVADLIMLGLATHEPHFAILREEFKPVTKRPCEICNQFGHDMKECTGQLREKKGEVK